MRRSAWLATVPTLIAVSACGSTDGGSGAGGGDGGGGPCTRDAAVVLARAYVLAAPVRFDRGTVELNDGRRLASFVAERPDDFAADAPVVRCAAALSAHLIQRGAESYDPDAESRVLEMAPPELGHLAPEVGQRINSGAVEMTQIGDMLGWMSRILPQMAAGNTAAYQTGSMFVDLARQQAAQVVQALQLYCPTDPAGCELMIQQLAPMQRHVDEAAELMIFELAMMMS